MVALVDDVLRTERIARPFFKLFQDIGAHTGAVAKPLHVLFPLLVVEGQGELVEKGGEAHDVNIRIVLAPFFQLFLHIDLRLGLPHVVGQLVGRIFPVVCDEIIHMHRIPDQKREEADGVLVIRNGLDHNLACRAVVLPAVCGNDLACRAVHDFPPALRRVDRIDFELFCVEAFHKPDAKTFALRRDAVADQVFLLDLLRVLHRPVVILACGVVGCIYFGILVQELFGHGRAVAVAQGICAQQIFQPDRLINHIYICRQRQSACVFHIHCTASFFACLLILFVVKIEEN